MAPHGLIATITIALGAAFLGGFLATKVRLPPIVGYLAAGIAVGPFTPGLRADRRLWHRRYREPLRSSRRDPGEGRAVRPSDGGRGHAAHPLAAGGGRSDWPSRALHPLRSRRRDRRGGRRSPRVRGVSRTRRLPR